jgi:hypothetical protein
MLTFIYREPESAIRGQGRAQIRSLDNGRMYRLARHGEGPQDARSSSAEKERRVDEVDEWGKWR